MQSLLRYRHHFKCSKKCPLIPRTQTRKCHVQTPVPAFSEGNSSVYASIQTVTTVQTGKHTHFTKSSHAYTHCTAGRLADSLGRYQAFDGVLGSSTLLGQKCVYVCVRVCVCVFVVKSTLATVCLSISPVWQRWKELLFRGQPHPTLINSAARASGREGGMDGGAEVEADRGGWEETEGAWRCSRPKSRRHPLLSSVPTPFPAWIPFYFYLCLIHSFSIYFFWTNPLIFSLH